jgi:hypothetical protein
MSDTSIFVCLEPRRSDWWQLGALPPSIGRMMPPSRTRVHVNRPRHIPVVRAARLDGRRMVAREACSGCGGIDVNDRSAD